MGALILFDVTIPAHASNPTFGNILNLSNNPASCPGTCSGLPRIATSGSHVYVVWLNNSAGNSNLLFATSSNGGSSFGPVVKITNSTTGNADQQQIAVTGNDVYIVWQQNISQTGDNILFRASTNNGTSFGPVITVMSAGSSCGGGCTISTSTLPQIAAVKNNVYLVWRSKTNKGSNEILFKASNINGSNFATITALVLSSTAYGSAQPQISAVNSYVYTTWSDVGTVGRAQIFFSASSNNGTSFAYVAAHSLSSTPVGETDLYQEMTVAGAGVYVAWTNDTMTTDNTMFAASANNGASFSTGVNLNKASVTDIYPQLESSGSSVYVAWTEASGGNSGVLYRASNNMGTSFGSLVNLSNTQGTSISVCPSQANCMTISVTGAYVYVAWVESGALNNGVYIASSSDNGSTFGVPTNVSNDSVSNNPVVASSGNTVYVVWEDDNTGNGDIYFVASVFDFSISNSGPVSVTQGSSVSNMITLTLQSGSPQPVTLTCVGSLPAGASCSFNPSSSVPGFSSNLTINTSTSTPTGVYNVTVTGMGGSFSHSTYVLLTVKSSGSVGGAVVGLDQLALLTHYLAFALIGGALTALTVFAGRKRIHSSALR